MRISILNLNKDPVGQYASSELGFFLEKHAQALATNLQDAERLFFLDVDTSMAGHAYRLISSTWEGKPVISLVAGSPGSLLTAVYDLLGRIGIRFSSEGDSIHGTCQFHAIDNLDEQIVPFCRNRGIRQHINFPMDISAYPLDEARAYIRNLARMGMNAITFHSYTGQWHGYQTADTTVLAGNFFYGQRHLVPEYAPIRRAVRNKVDFCIPEAESLMDNPEERDHFARHWLASLIETSRNVGLHVCLSLELLADVEQSVLVNMIRQVLMDYPLIDSLEWISPEGGGSGKGLTLANLDGEIRRMFGHFDTDLIPPDWTDVPEALPGTLSNLKLASDLYLVRDRIFAGLPTAVNPDIDIRIGLYVMDLETLHVAKRIMDRILPASMIRTFLPAHGATAVAEQVNAMNLDKGDWQHTLLYSWIEFDGNMYLQQNSCPGLEQLLEQARQKAGSESIEGLCLNHWRTAENSLTLRYAAQAMVHPIPAVQFYRQEAELLGMTSPDDFAQLMVDLGQLDIDNRDKLFNIGFCYLGCWLMFPGLGWIRNWKAKDMANSIQRYEDLVHWTDSCRPAIGSVVGAWQLKLLANRMLCSIEQIKAVASLESICQLVDDEHPEQVDPAEKDAVTDACDQAMAHIRCYIDQHLQMMTDRGCEGTLVSYYHTMPVYVDHIRQYFVHGETECIHMPPTFDQPPPPDLKYLS